MKADGNAVRRRIRITQAEIAAKFAISLGTLRGDRTPRDTAVMLLNVISGKPRAVMRALASP